MEQNKQTTLIATLRYYLSLRHATAILDRNRLLYLAVSASIKLFIILLQDILFNYI